MVAPQLPVGGLCPWEGFDPATISFCEERLCAWVAEPANAYSSLTKILAGGAVLWSCRGHRDALVAVGVAGVLQGFLGFSFHATGTFWGEALDVCGMFLIAGMFVTFALGRLRRWSPGRLVLVYGGLTLVSLATLLTIRPSGIYVFAVQIAVWVGLEVALFRREGRSTDYRYLKLLVGTFAIGFAFWITDKTGLLCDPDNHIFGGHAAWHCLTSLAVYFFYAYQTQFRAPVSKALGEVPHSARTAAGNRAIR